MSVGQVQLEGAKPMVEIVPQHAPEVLPVEFPKKERLIYKPSAGSLEGLNRLYRQHLVETEQSEASFEIQPFTYKTDDPFIHNSIEELNNDYQQGVKKNQTVPVHKLRRGVHLDRAVFDLKKSLKETYEKEAWEVEKLRNRILQLARKPPAELEQQVLEKAALMGGKKTEIGEKECMALFLQADPEEFKRLTNLTDNEEIHALYQLIGDYLSLSRKVDHMRILRGYINELEALIDLVDKDKEQNALLQKIGNFLSQGNYVDPEIDPNAFLVLQHGLHLFLKPDQVEGLREMLPTSDQTKFPNVVLQRIQGGGKTLIFGHALALLKADGYHLSIHVPPTAQYGTARYDMQHISGKVFGQKERTLEFDDNPHRFTVEYLTWMKDTMTTAVVNREYITMTNETLRAMRCKYVKTRLMIEKKLIDSKVEETEEINKLEKSNAILKQMLTMLRERGVFTFDEYHQHADPTKELNMPFGEISHISVPEAKVMAKIMALAANARNEKGPLLKLHENQQSQQTQDQYRQMLEMTVDKFLNDPAIQHELAVFSVNEKKDQELLRDYLLGKTANLPHVIAKKADSAREILNDPEAQRIKQAADLIVLGKQMLAGKWMKECTDKSVDEHHGFSKTQQGPLVAIPYVANTKPSEVSDF